MATLFNPTFKTELVDNKKTKTSIPNIVDIGKEQRNSKHFAKPFDYFGGSFGYSESRHQQK
jgi:hypothetical protein